MLSILIAAIDLSKSPESCAVLFENEPRYTVDDRPNDESSPSARPTGLSLKVTTLVLVNVQNITDEVLLIKRSNQ